MRRCQVETDRGRICGQTVWGDDEWCTYHQKQAKGMLESPTDFMSDEEMNATVWGRPRRDGRRLDEYTLPAPAAPTETWDWLDDVE